MKKICSWCQGQMVIPLHRRPEVEDPTVYYGMCGSCLETELEALARSPRPRIAVAR